jgi:hypothetical protein
MPSPTLNYILKIFFSLAETSIFNFLLQLLIYFIWKSVQFFLYYSMFYTVSLAFFIIKGFINYLKIGFFRPFRQTENNVKNNVVDILSNNEENNEEST